MESSPEEAERHQLWSAWHAARQGRDPYQPPGDGGRHACPCCGCRTLDERGMYDICPVCFWEDDGQDDHDADAVRGGPNGPLSLAAARANYAASGACEAAMLENVRPPTAEERPNPGRP